MANSFGCMLKPHNIRNYDINICGDASTKPLPKEYMISEDILPLVDDQGMVNSCVAHSIAKVMESIYLKKFGNRKLFSRGYIYGNPACRTFWSGYGLYVDDAINGVRKCGDVPITDFDIDEEFPEIMDLVNARSDLKDKAEQFKFETYIEVPIYAMLSRRLEELKKALFTYELPIVIASAKYFGGGHCIVAVGWDKNDNIIFQNSWGTSYKEKGYGRLSISQIDEAYVILPDKLQLPFTDVDESVWYLKYVKLAYFSGIMNGSSDTTFEPDNNITRAETTAIAMRVLEKIENNFNNWAKTMELKGKKVNEISISSKGSSNPFGDLNPSEWYYSDVLNGVATGFIQGDDCGTFRPDEPITRAEFATVIVRTADMIYDAFSANNTATDMPKITDHAVSYSDISQNDWYYANINKVNDYGLMNGDTEGTFRPSEYITRAEAAATIVRLMETVDGWLEYFCEKD